MLAGGVLLPAFLLAGGIRRAELGVCESIAAVIMVGPARVSSQEQLVDRAIRASVQDMIVLLSGQGIQPVIVAGPELSWLPEVDGVLRDLDRGAFHFGQRLADVIERYGLTRVLYVGAGSAPLFDRSLLDAVRTLLGQTHSEADDAPLVATNNLHSSDWFGVTHAQAVLPVLRDAARDNGLAWSLQQQGCVVRTVAGASSARRVDLDTPTDLALLRLQATYSPQLTMVLRDPLLDRVPVERVIDVAARDGSRIALVGRVAPRAWQALSDVTQAWIRVYSEERGMVAAGRLERGETRSLLGRLLALVGPTAFFEELGRVADAAIIDSRVMMAAQGVYPTAADRFASDLLWVDAIDDVWTRAFTAAAVTAPLPVLLGGHGVVSGGLLMLADAIAARRDG